MSFFENPDLQIWNNAAFDNGESKENRSASMAKSPVSVKSQMPVKPLHPKNSIENSNVESNKIVHKDGFVKEEESRDEIKIDSEIHEIEMEINRLSLRLESLRLEKLEKNAKTVERKGRIIHAKFMDEKKSSSNLGVLKKIENPSSLMSFKEIDRRGVSLGPSEIMAGFKSRRLSSQIKSEITPIQSVQSRRKSCFWKLGDIDECKVTKERGGKCSSVSPKARKTATKCNAPRLPLTSVGSKKKVKKEDDVLSSLIQPKKLFNGEKSNPGKKPLKSGRVVASRYHMTPIRSNGASSALRKRSFPEDDKEEDGKRIDKKRSSLMAKSQGSSSECSEFEGIVSRLKKKWEIPTDSSSPNITTTVNADNLPKIKTIRCVNETPRDSGAAKRVADLVNKKSFFGDGEYDDDDDEAMEPSICQALSFVDEHEEE